MSAPYLGEIRLFPYVRGAPVGWAPCNGQLVPISTNESLYALIGTTYGGDGQTTFGLPDLRGRVPVHFGHGPGLKTYVPGQKSGTEDVTLTVATMPSHGHMIEASTIEGSEATPSGALLARSPEGTALYADPTGLIPTALPQSTVTVEGGGRPHENCMPTLAINCCIALQGLYPTQN